MSPAFENKICAPEQLYGRLAAMSRPLVFTNGVFDILHRGHATYLSEARAQGSSLVVALNSDASVKRLGKGEDRPINRLDDRMAVVAALQSVDLVTWFEEDTPLTAAVVEQLAAFAARVIDRESLSHCTRDAVAAVIEWAVREAGVGGRITTELGTVADVLREANYEARGRLVERAHVELALKARRERDDMPERRVLESMERNAIRVQCRGEHIGQVNGLAVYHVGGHDFGRPLRITCTAGAGRAGIVSIERESRLSGRSHDKGMQILTGWLRSRFGQVLPLTFTAAIAFEQSYSTVDGDSASSAEIYVLLSALAEIPLRQDLAVTGSVNQFGEIQAIGGVNEKIEGFFAACSIAGLTGDQGVLIPADNLLDLCVSERVVAACAAGKFHVYGVRHVDEGIAMLTGRAAGTVERGGYTPGSVYALVAERLEALFRASRRK